MNQQKPPSLLIFYTIFGKKNKSSGRIFQNGTNYSLHDSWSVQSSCLFQKVSKNLPALFIRESGLEAAYMTIQLNA